MITHVIKRNGTRAPFKQEKITWAIYKAAAAVGGDDFAKAQALSNEVTAFVSAHAEGDAADVETIQDAVEKILIERGHAKTAKAFIPVSYTHLFRARGRSRLQHGRRGRHL